jgi:hypothetical protein
MQIVPAAEIDAAEQDAFVAGAPMGTFLHTRRFLSYHGSRFRDLSLAIVDERQHLVGLLPAAADPEDERRVVSHPGLTYGGLVHEGRLRGERMIEALEMIRRHYREQGFDTFRYKPVPYIYHRSPAGDDLYALFRLGAHRNRCDLSSAIDLAERRPPSERRRRSLNKASKSGLEIGQGAELIEPLWSVLEENLASRYGAVPVHAAGEITRLHALFPAEIAFVAALLDGKVEAGLVLFTTPRVMRAQYIASTGAGYQICAIDALVDVAIAQAQARGARYFDFGTSNAREGRHLNEGLYQFKSEFGGGGVAYETYELDLRS